MTDKQNYFTYTDNTSDSNDKTMESLHKQIIIDGVDVGGCENLMQGIVPFGCMEDRKTCSCMNNPNCLYKQFKRKERECEELQSHFKQMDESNKILYQEKCELLQQLDLLKAENRELKAVHSTNVALSDELFKYKAENDSIKSELMQTNCYLDADKEIIDNLKQTLTEIKDIVEKKCLGCTNFCNDESIRFCVTKQILQKISEVG